MRSTPINTQPHQDFYKAVFSAVETLTKIKGKNNLACISEKQKDQYQQKVDHLEKWMKQKKSQKEFIEATIGQLKVALQKRDQILNDHNDILKKMKKQRIQKKATQDKLAKDLDIIKGQIIFDQLNKIKEVKIGKAELQRNYLSSIESEISCLKKEYAQDQLQFKQFQELGFKDKAKKLKDKFQTNKQKLDELQKKEKTIKKNILDLGQQQERLQQSARKLELQMWKLNNQIERKMNEIQILQNQSSNEQKQILELQKQVKQAQKQMQKKKMQMNECKAELERYEEEQVKYRKEANRLEKQQLAEQCKKIQTQKVKLKKITKQSQYAAIQQKFEQVFKIAQVSFEKFEKAS